MKEAQESGDESALLNATKWFFLMHTLLLRKPPRRGKHARRMIAHRVAAWQQGRLGQLIAWWHKDRHIAMQNTRPTRGRQKTNEPNRKIIRLIEQGEIAKASNILMSQGLADVERPDIMNQLEAKHPQHAETGVKELGEYGQFQEMEVDLFATFAGLRPRKGTGHRGYGTNICVLSHCLQTASNARRQNRT
jgi:hypothetical protein